MVRKKFKELISYIKCIVKYHLSYHSLRDIIGAIVKEYFFKCYIHITVGIHLFISLTTFHWVLSQARLKVVFNDN